MIASRIPAAAYDSAIIGRRPTVSKSRDEHDGPEEVAHRERQEIEPDVVRAHAVETAQDERVGEEDRVVRERLRRHERQAEDRPSPVSLEEDARDLAEADRAAGLHPDRRTRRGQRTLVARHVGLDRSDDALGLVDAAVEQEPARALGQMAANQEDDASQRRAEDEGEAPAEVRGDEARIEQDDRGRGAERGADPVGAVDDEVDAAAHVRGHQLVDGRVDGRALAADPRARDGAPEREAREADREPGHERGAEVDRERDEEEPPPAERVGQAPEDERPRDGAGEVGARRRADLGSR